jgi:hypothetical protein
MKKSMIILILIVYSEANLEVIKKGRIAPFLLLDRLKARLTPPQHLMLLKRRHQSLNTQQSYY